MEHPILFSTPMVQAIMEGRKTMTRRIVKPPFSNWITNENIKSEWANGINDQCNYGIPGDLLWVRETWNTLWGRYIYKADFEYGFHDKPLWKPSIFMPKKACRIWLEVVSVKVERLQDITEENAIKEGVTNAGSFRGIGVDDDLANRYAFRELWNKINGEGSWDANPWVWAIGFKKIKN